MKNINSFNDFVLSNEQTNQVVGGGKKKRRRKAAAQAVEVPAFDLAPVITPPVVTPPVAITIEIDNGEGEEETFSLSFNDLSDIVSAAKDFTEGFIPYTAPVGGSTGG